MDFLKITKLLAQDYFAVPDYQRDYEWTNSQNSTLLDDVFSIVEDYDGPDHFLGAIVTIPYEESNAVNKVVDLKEYDIEPQYVKHVVDGQQRLTSISLLTKAVYDAIDEDDELTDANKNGFKSNLNNILLGSDSNDNCTNPPRMILNGNTGKCYNTYLLKVSNDHFNKGYRGAKRLLDAYNLFKSEIIKRKNDYLLDDKFSDAYAYYRALTNTITKKLIFVEIECGASADAFQVFDSLNGKGLDLTAADRIKNIMLSWSPKGKGAQKWDAFVQEISEDYIVSFFVSLFFYMNGKRISKNKLPEAFKNNFKNSALNGFDYFYHELKNDGIAYGKLRKNSTGNTKLDYILKDIQTLHLDQAYVLLFAAAKTFKEDSFKTNEFTLFAESLLNLVVRMQVSEKSMNKLDSIFSKLIDMMKNQNASLSVLTDELKKRKLSLVPDDVFETNFSKYAPRDTKIDEFYLRHLEEEMRKNKGNRSHLDRDLTVEHIIPQTLDDLSDWYGSEIIPDEIIEDFKNSVVENIGNKALLFKDDNSSASNNSYDKKINVYKTGKKGQSQGNPQNTFELINDLLTKYPNKFTHTEVENRAKELAKLAIKIW